MAALDTVSDYLSASRTLLQDEATPYRYSDASLVDGLNFGLLEARKLRPDLFINRTVPSFNATQMATKVVFDQQYRTSLMYYICGHAQLRDDESTQDNRATIFLNKFVSQLLSIAA